MPFKSILAFAEKAAQVDLANPAQATALKAAYEVLIGKSIDRDTFIAILTGKADVNTRLEYGIPELAKFPINILIQAAQTQAHGHLHVLGGGEMGLYMDFPRKGDYWLRRFGTTEGDAESRQRREDERKQREAQQADAPTQDEQR